MGVIARFYKKYIKREPPTILGKLESKRIKRSAVKFSSNTIGKSGGFATVDQALLNKERVAVKRITIKDDTEIDRLLEVRCISVPSMRELTARYFKLAVKEADFLADLSHENVIQLKGLVENISKNIIWLVFPWADNGDLSAFVASQDWAIPERISLIRDVTEGVVYLHSQQPPIYHGDLKSLNILVNSDYRAVITDFGSARRLNLAKHSSAVDGRPDPPPPIVPVDQDESIQPVRVSTEANRLTLTAENYTLRWAAPELLNGDRASLACDIWSLGWIAYEVMFGQIPFQNVNQDAAVIYRVIMGDLPSLTEDARMTLVRALGNLMAQCWSLNASQRPKAKDCKMALSWTPKIVPSPIADRLTPAVRFREALLSLELGTMYSMQCDYSGASACFTKALDIFTSDGRVEWRAKGLISVARVHHARNDKGRANAVLEIAHVHRLRNEHDEAVQRYTEALQAYSDSGDMAGRATATSSLAHLHASKQEHDKAIQLYSEALQITSDIGNKSQRATILWALAELYRLRDENDKAIPLYYEALQICDDIGNWNGKADNEFGLAGIHRVRTEYVEAVRLYSKAGQTRTEIGNKAGTADVAYGLGEIHRLQGEFDEATQQLSDAFRTYTEVGSKNRRATVLWSLAKVHRSRDQPDEAVKLFSEALQIFTDIEDRASRADAALAIAEIHRFRSKYEEAIKLYSEAYGLYADIGSETKKAWAAFGLAECHRSRDEHEEALQRYSETLQRYTDIGDKEGQADVAWGLAEIYRSQQEYDKAVKIYSETLQTLTDIGERARRTGARCLSGLAAIHRFRTEHEEATELYLEAIEIFTNIGDEKGKAVCHEGLTQITRLKSENPVDSN
ncbi:hypothetical protein FRB90_008052 [Tulasnella sp. 427]|nr:hypothetical protein FRB90_008052 [Tulasnella sp. 427]